MPARLEALTGTTLRVYRLVYRKGPIRLSDIQRQLKLSSASVSEYHIRKLIRLQLIFEGMEGYNADRTVFENMVRIRRTIIPIWATFSAFLLTSLIFLLTLLRPVTFTTPSYLFSLITIAASLIVALYQTLTTLEHDL